MKKKKLNYFLPFISAFICMAVIFFFSSQDGEKNNNISMAVTERISRIIFDNLDIQSNDVQYYVIHNMHIIIRKTAHFALYGILGAVTYIAAHSLKEDFRKCFAASLGFPLIYAAADEIHQIFTDGRTARLFDVFIDELGAAAGSVTAFAVIACIDYLKQNNGIRKN